ncbi:MAG: ankyrin repeat domain-containing protein [Proteobacteria bacterium]|nr:ankyrin repeat domain-containing protein [Pseudomonadota bacterium]
MEEGPKSDLLIKACQEGKLDEVGALLEQGVNANVADEDGRSPLMWAAYNGFNDICLKLIEKGADLKAKDNYGSTALMFAAQAGFSKVCETLLKSGEKGALVNVQNNLGKTPLDYAADFKEIKELLLTQGAYVPTAFIQACQQGKLDEVKAFLDKGENVHQTDQFGKTALYYLSLDFKPAIVKALLEKGADPKFEQLFMEPAGEDFSKNINILNKKVHLLLSKMSFSADQLSSLTRILCQKAKALVEHAKGHPNDVEDISFALMTWLVSLGHYNQEGLLEIKQAINAISPLWTTSAMENLSIGGIRFPSDFAKQFNMNKLSEPTESDSALYKKLYYALKELQQSHTLGHRFGLKGKRDLLGLSVTYQYAYAGLMQEMLKDTYQGFHQENNPPLKALQDVFENVDQAELNAALDNIYQDVMQVNQTAEKAAQRLSENHNVSITITSRLGFSSGHFTCMVGNNEFLIYGDRYPTENNGSGLEIMAFDEQTTQAQKIALLDSLSNKGINEDDIDDFQPRNFLAQTKEKFNLKKVYFIDRSAQKADTCGWASSAKLVVQANAFLHFYQLSKDFTKAQEAAKILYDAWSKDFDRVKALEDYLEFHQKMPPEYKMEPDKLLLAMILLQSEQKQTPFRQKVTEMIQKSGLVDEVARRQAQENLKDIIEDHLEEKAKEYTQIRKISFDALASERQEKKEVFDETRYVETYLRKGTKEADEELENLVQETLRQRLRNKDKREKERVQIELTDIIKKWSASSDKFETIKGQLEATLNKGAKLELPDSNSNYAIKMLMDKYMRHRYPVAKEESDELDKCLAFFLEKGAPLFIGDKPLIHEVATEGALKCLIERGASIDAPDNEGKTLLMNYISKSYAQGVEFLLKQGANISLTDKEGHDAMFYAVARQNEAIIKLLEGRAKPSVPKGYDLY